MSGLSDVEAGSTVAGGAAARTLVHQVDGASRLPASVAPGTAVAAEAGWSPWARARRRFFRHRLARLGGSALLLLALAALVLPAVFPEATTRQNLLATLEPPSLAHPLGTDDLGRDVLVRVAAGGRVSLAIGLLSMAVAVVAGTCIGAIAGYAGGATDAALMRVTDLALSFPSLLLLILMGQVLGTSLVAIVVAIGALRWMSTARVVRAAFLLEKRLEYVEAARTIGASPWRIVVRHVLPNVSGPLIVTATLGVAGAIVTESTLSYLGLGVQPPTPTWGNLLRGAQDQLFVAPWLAIFPGIAIFLAVLGINTIGDALRDATAPSAKD